MEHITKTGILFGTFDILHPGHLDLFSQARKKSGYLIAVIARDKTVFQIKKRYPKNLEKARQKNAANYGVADKVILGSLTDKFASIKKYQPDIIFLGYDQIAFTKNLKEKLRELKLKNTKIIRLKSFQPKIYKTAKMLNTHRSVGAIIKNDKGEILMHERVSVPPGWACAAGHVEDGETPEHALIREVKEETNLDVKKYKLTMHEFMSWNKCSRGVLGHDWFLYEVEEWQGEILGDKKETKNIGWKSIAEIKKLKLEKAWEYCFKKLKIL
jgi:cytidyltransferase-like protein